MLRDGLRVLFSQGPQAERSWCLGGNLVHHLWCRASSLGPAEIGARSYCYLGSLRNTRVGGSNIKAPSFGDQEP